MGGTPFAGGEAGRQVVANAGRRQTLSLATGTAQLRAFLAVAEYKHFTQAASALKISQSSLSRTIAALERCLGQRLVIRSRHVIRLSDAGELFLPYADSAVAAAAEAFEKAHALRLPLRVGFTWNALGEDTGPLVNRFETEHPGATVHLQRCDDAPLAGLADGRSHLAILRSAPDGDIDFFRFRDENRVAALPLGHPLARQGTATLAQTRNDPLVVNIISGSGTPELWSTTPPGRRIVEVNNVDEWLEAVAAGRGIGVSTSSTATLHRHPGVIYVPLKDADPVSVLIAWRSLDSHPHTAHFVAAAKRWSRSRAHA
ncbi:LysR family transcriptional regulator [Streptomyces lydicus]|uniref:LysR family transcriptional regulator n=1 Tax=Streptomyces lydicus TaxID=47763 RepID=UPI00101106EA|nr:LysR family transcriptional regulator [Streptomyces lydicus]MCZ1011344.1 LysR family transcriptional regulator [Streptomyces lydicus]